MTMSRHLTSSFRRAFSRCACVAVAVLTFWYSAAVHGQTAVTSAHVAATTLDAVNVGENAPQGRLTGFGPPEPRTHGGSWGGAPTPDFYRVLWFQNDPPFGIAELNIPPHTVAQKVEIDYLNGISGCFGSPLGDTFQVYAANRPDPIEWTLIGTVVWDASACTAGEQERAVVFYLRTTDGQDAAGLGGGRNGKKLFLRLVSAAGVATQPWDLFSQFGQVGIHSVRLIGKVTG